MYEQLIDTSPHPSSVEILNQLLPLPELLAQTLPWRICCAEKDISIELSELTCPQRVSEMDKVVLAACKDVLRRELKQLLAEETLPVRILDSMVAPEAMSEVKADLRLKGYKEGAYDGNLNIRQALPYIGRRANRLVQCIDPTAIMEESDVAQRPWQDLAIHPRALTVGIMAARKQGKLQSHLACTKTLPRLPTEPPYKWATTRQNASVAICLEVDSGVKITGQDPRFGWQLCGIHARISLKGQSLGELQSAIADRDDQELTAACTLLFERVAAARLMTVTQEATSIIEALVPRQSDTGSSVQILGPRYGLFGQELTLQECGDNAGMTRERIRQIQVLLEKRTSQGTVYLPCVTAFLNQLGATPTSSMSTLNKTFETVLGTQTLSGVLEFADLFGLKADGAIIDCSLVHPYVLSAKCWSKTVDEAIVTCIVRSARAMTGRIGAFHLSAVQGDITEELGFHISRNEIKEVIDSCAQCVWLEEEMAWGTILGATEGPVLEEVRKMLAVSFPISLDITEIYAGLAQCRRQSTNRSSGAARFGGGLPPPWVVRKLLDFQEDMQVAQYDNFRLKDTIDPLTLMEGETDKRIYNTLKAFGGVASWREMHLAIVDDLEINPVSFAVMLKSCSYIYQPAFGIYAFRGQRMHIHSVVKDGRLREFSTTPNHVTSRINQLSSTMVEFDLPQTTSTKGRSRVVYVPTGIRSEMLGKFVNKTDNTLYIVIGKNRQISRIADEFESGGVKPKDRVTMTIDLEKREYSWTPVAARTEIH